jgi:hypothetical protein
VRRSMGSLGVDGTLVKAHSRSYKRKKGDKPKKGKKPAIEVHSVDPDAGFYVREADSRDEDPDGAGKDRVAWGYEATFAVSGSEDPDTEPAYPNLIVGMGVLAKPGQSPGRHGARVLGSLHERRYQPGMLAADRAFSSAKPADFQLPALALGYRPVYDYKIDQLGAGGVRGLPPDRRSLVLPVHHPAPHRCDPGLPGAPHRRTDVPDPPEGAPGVLGPAEG